MGVRINIHFCKLSIEYTNGQSPTYSKFSFQEDEPFVILNIYIKAVTISEFHDICTLSNKSHAKSEWGDMNKEYKKISYT